MRFLLSLLFSVCIILGTKAEKMQSQSTTLQQEFVTFKAKILDSSGIPLPGVYAFVEGTTIAAASDANGILEIRFEKDVQLSITFSYVGMKDQIITYNGTEQSITIKMQEDSAMLDDVVVIGYGNKNRGSLTSSVASVDKDNMKALSKVSGTVDNMLAGTVKGVLVRQSSGEPGATPLINVRGITSPFQGNNQPLYVIDGVPTYVSSTNNLNPLLALSNNDIESIDILKDAAATAIYGSRGANGVVIVKTKKGKKQVHTLVNFGYTITVANPINEYNLLNRDEFLDYHDELLRNTVADSGNNIPMSLYDFADITQDTSTGLWKYNGLNQAGFGKANTNWTDETTNRNALTHQYNVGFQGGSASSSYSFSFNGTNQEGILINDKFHHYSTRINLNTELSTKIQTGISINYAFAKRESGSTENNPLFEGNSKTWAARPDMPVYNSQETFQRLKTVAVMGNIFTPNPVADLSKENTSKNNQLLGNIFFEYEIIKDLKLHTDANFSYFQFDSDIYTPKTSQTLIETPSMPGAPASFFPIFSTLGISNSKVFNSSINARLDYSKEIERHNIKAMIGIGRDRTFQNSRFYNYSDLISKDLHNISSASVINSNLDTRINSGLNSLYGRLSYDFASRYLAEFSLRMDESSKFAPGHRTAYFPAASLGWKIVNEKFMENIKQIDDLKLRFSLGQTGSTNVDDFAYIQQIITAGSKTYNGKPYLKLKENLPNGDIGWEMTTEHNIGLDFSLFNHRLYGSIDVYNRKTDGALAPAPYLLSSGATSYTANIIDMSNKGFELQLGGDIIRNDNFTWASSLNLSSNKSRIDNLNGANLDKDYANAYQEGEPYGVLKGYRVKQIIQKQETIDQLNAEAKKKGYLAYQDQSTKVGDYLYEDINGDGHIDSKDETAITKPDPNFFGGWINTLSYKNFTLSIFSQFSYGGTAFWEGLAKSADGTLGNSILREMYKNTWSPKNTNARYARITNSSNLNSSANDRYVFDNSFFRLKNISLSYNLKTSKLENLGINGLEFSINATNLFTLTDWPGLDPDVIMSGKGAGKSRNNDPYPASKTISLGLKLHF